MNNIIACLIVVVGAAIVGGFAYDYVKVDEMPENKSVTDIIEKERFTIEYKDHSLLNVIHDNELNVTCWSKGSIGGISCIPDNQLNIP